MPKTFIVFSASDTASPRYCLGLLTLTGPDPLIRANWKKTPHPVFEWSPENSIYGPGRGTFAKAKDGSMWLLYAAKSTGAPNAAHRETRAQRFTWNADLTPSFGVPEKDSRSSRKRPPRGLATNDERPRISLIRITPVSVRCSNS